jgi:hypothetical protein
MRGVTWLRLVGWHWLRQLGRRECIVGIHDDFCRSPSKIKGQVGPRVIFDPQVPVRSPARRPLQPTNPVKGTAPVAKTLNITRLTVSGFFQRPLRTFHPPAL